MRKSITLLLLTAILIFTFVGVADAKQPCYVVTYLEVKFDQTGQAIALLKNHARESRKESENQYYQVLQNLNRQSNSALLEKWENKSAQSAHSKSKETIVFHKAIEPIIVSGFDERLHLPLQVNNWSEDSEALFTLTHVDIKPKVKEKGVKLVKELVDRSRNTAGNIRFDALTQADMTNHMTLVETWNSLDDRLSNAARTDIRSIRIDLTKIIGGLYDDRLYIVVD